MHPRLRLFNRHEDGSSAQPPQVTMTLGEFCRILSEAQRFDSTWLQDFANDEVVIPEDLHDVMSTYWSLRPGA